MIAIITLMIIAMLIAGSAAFTLFNTISSGQIALNSVHFKEEILSVKKMLLARSTVFTVQEEKEEGVFETITYPALPAGVPNGAYNTIPSDFLKSANVYSKSFVYCPFGAITEADYSTSINAGPASVYAANTAIFSKNGRPSSYVVSTQQNQFTSVGVAGLLISPYATDTGSVRCSDVIYEAQHNRFTVAGGRVETISFIEIEAANLNN